VCLAHRQKDLPLVRGHLAELLANLAIGAEPER
jgi:hypothetical protein